MAKLDMFNAEALSIGLLENSFREHFYIQGDTVLLSEEEWRVITNTYNSFMEAKNRRGASSFSVDWDQAVKRKANPKMDSPVERDYSKTINQQREEMGCLPVDGPPLPPVYISVTWTAITADQVEKVAKFAAELGVPFNLNTQDPIYGDDEDTLTHDHN